VTLARRLAGTAQAAGRLQRANPGLEQPLLDRAVRVPLAALRGELRLEAVGRLFPADRRVAPGWEHWVLDPFGGGEESWALLAEVFAGRPDLETELRRAARARAGGAPPRGRPVLIPEAVLLAAFRAVEPAPVPTATPSPSVAEPARVDGPDPTSSAAPVPTAQPRAEVPPPSPTPSVAARPSPPRGNGVLDYGTDGEGDYAVYRLRRGEALYSAVVIRFTGQLEAAQVNRTAEAIARRSGIDDVTSIPVGQPIRIPLDLLLPEHLPADHERRRAWEQEQRELARFVEVVHAADLSGVHVILDAGHGGQDTGAVVKGVWEATYVYDIFCRIKANLERHTRATVWSVRKDPRLGFEPPARDLLEQRRGQILLTRPPYGLQDSTVGVHLRWYLTNHIVTRRVGREVPRSRTVFLSVHADSLHPSVRGAMVYVPARGLRPDRYAPQLRALQGFEEARDEPTVVLGRDFRARAEASSRRLAAHVVASLRGDGIEVHPYEPVRDRVLRGSRSWVPAVLKYSLAQNAILVECCNMANDDDRAQLLEREWRERFARGVVAGIAAAFEGG
jgi:N-acetylmuramoyl-L-alanine amidase